MSEAIRNQIASLLLVWQQLTGQPLNMLAMQRMFYDYLAIGFTEDDLRCVLEHLNRENRKMKGRAAFAIRAHRVVGDLEYFGSMLGEARAMQRNQVKRTPAERILATRTGGVTETKTGDTARPAKAVVKNVLEKIAREL